MSLEKMEKQCDEVSLIIKAIAHPQRLMLLCYLIDKERNVSEILEQCDLSQSQLSQFLTKMQRQKVLKVRKKGQYSYYSIADQRVLRLMTSIQKIFCNKENLK